MFSNISCDTKIKIRDVDNFMDWFSTTSDKIKNVYKTNLYLYILNTKILKYKLPINFEKIDFIVKCDATESTFIDYIKLEIPEMNIKVIKKIGGNYIHHGDTINFDFSFSMEV